MIREKLKKLLNIKVIYFVICLFVITLFICLKNTYAYYSSETDPVPIFTSRVGNFSGKGDTSPLTDRTTDVNLMFYVQDVTNPKNYTIMEGTPALVSGYVVNDKKSNCIPTSGTYTMHEEKVYSISEDGLVTVEMSQDNPNQVVCRIYYDYGKDLTQDDVIVFALIEDSLGMVIKNNKHYTMIEDIPTSGYTYDNTISGCNTTNNAKTTISYDTSKGFSFETDGPNICYAYFNKS